MSSTQQRRLKRKMEQDIKKSIKGKGERNIPIPTEKDVEEYINKKINNMKDAKGN